MHLYVDPKLVPLAELEAVADSMGMQLYDFADNGVGQRGKYAGRARYKFVLRPLHGGSPDARYRAVRDNPYGVSGERRIWAICWHGHRDFMRAVFRLDPDATFKTSVDTWDGSDDFEARHEFSGHRNIGSMMAPQSYADACHCPAGYIIGSGRP